MPRTLREELKQTKPFGSAEQEALLSIERTAAVFRHRLGEELKQFGVTPTQFNVLRILRGAGPAGLCRNEIRDRLVSQVPDVTRLLDRLETMGYVERERDEEDRRLVTTRITAAGRDLLASLDAPMVEEHRRRLGHMSETQLRTLADLLADARSGAGAVGDASEEGEEP
jgi:DNA-binding MarR family transcriptional regulator